MSSDSAVGTAPLTRADFQSDQDVRWCPGCGDYAILKAVQTVLPELGIPREKFVVVSGIGCSSRFPYYMNTYGFHSIHGRAPAIATGLKTTRPDLEVWVVTGDGDGLSIGGNHLIHALRRNVGLKILLFNNRIYGLTKGQYSPTSEVGKRTSSTPYGSVDNPFDPLALALGAGATFVARSVDVFQPHLMETLRQASAHQGAAFVEIFQNCNIFNDGAFAYATDKQRREDNVLELVHGQPLVYAGGTRGLRATADLRLESLDLTDGYGPEDCLVWDETSQGMASLAARLGPPDFPTPIGILRRSEQATFEGGVVAQIEREIDRVGAGSLQELLYTGDVWEVDGSGDVV